MKRNEEIINGGEESGLEAQDFAPVPYIVHEGIESRFERIIHRLIAVVILLIVLLVGSNVGWLVYEAQYQTVETTQVEQDASENSVNHYVGGDYNGDKADGDPR